MWIECHGKNKKQKLPCVFYQPRPEDQEKLIWIQKLDTILSAITTTWNKTIVIAGDTNIDYNKPSTVLETYKEVLDTYFKTTRKKANSSRCQNHRSHC